MIGNIQTIVSASLNVESRYSEVKLLGDAIATLDESQLSLLLDYLRNNKHMDLVERTNS